MSRRFLQDGKLDRAGVAAELDAFLGMLLRATRLDLKYTIEQHEPDPNDVESPEVVVTLSGRDQELLLEHQAELLNAVEYLALRWLKLDAQSYDRVRLESGDWRATRLEELKLSARVAAERVRETRQPFRFNPMSARERRVVHLALKEQPGVRTASEGAGERRQVVVYPS
jgi:spoIIIJ-associated protein